MIMTTTRMRDADIRTRLHAEFDDVGAAWVDEVQVKGCRTDMVAFVGGVLTAIEIKSGRDTLERLQRQMELVDWRFRQTLVVTEPRHVEGVRATVGARCGIWVCEERPTGFFLRRRSRAFGTRAPRPRDAAHPQRIVYGLGRTEIAAALGVEPESAPRGELAAALAARPIEEVEAVALEAWRQRKLTGENPKPHLASR